MEKAFKIIGLVLFWIVVGFVSLFKELMRGIK
jgi:hypothetical protein